ncbi:phosphate ABC transporter substrate-binding protein PstS [Ignavibacteria bacterium CHB1]|jgi:phosphate ABC transporter substrate-binding protein, PhoT family (TC 3.A.1.7.1)|nr:MAG: phosphate ABC transporter substrate-binding protein PstS [Chlorobiota bacterium]KXK02623.1 MAG: phosphate ABC transporter substrate-binding protein, PhoT family [Chlorobi bacterium OLB4]MBV6398756.1 Phosphate-binding protein PstS [Ignavibacteria bacterium]MCC6885072.1 phosphate ABC transporter substrate-binding protein PstS [Ignavibacteriales bacterium]MCE7952137.1 phosphate ABC transporter substrate-binding protein PstS [Chlorobi bacterium CHB7]MDL1886306.1 phosphate ABC transporter s
MKLTLSVVAVILFSVILLSCSRKSGNPLLKKGSEQINGAGATFPFPVYSKWVHEFQKVNPKAKINYQSIGSGGGIRQVTEKTVDFGASDIPLSKPQQDEIMSKYSTRLLQFPTVIGSVVLTFNLPGLQNNINLTQNAVVGIYSGSIKKWNDTGIVNSNPGVNFPDKEIVVCFRSDGSGTTYVFTDFLGKVSTDWREKVGVGQSIRFPVGQGAKGNEGVTGLVKQIEYSIGYVEYVYAVQNNLNYANIQNPAGQFVTPSIESLMKAAEYSVNDMPDDLGQSITNSGGDNTYPISSYTYIMVYENQDDPVKGGILKSFLLWAVTEGSIFAKNLGYAPLPEVVIQKVKGRLNLLNHNGKSL